MRLVMMTAVGLLAATSAAGQTLDQAKVVADGRAAQYSLQRQGFGGVTCTLTPDWETTLGQSRSDPGMTGAFEIFDQLKFTTWVDAEGAAAVDGVDAGAPRQGDAAAGIEQIFQGADDAVRGVFFTWSMFMVNSPFPPSGAAATVTPQAGGYRVAYKEGDADVTVHLERNLTISRVEVRAPAYRATIEPVFRPSSKGLVLTRYVADYVPTAGPGVTHLTVGVDYQSVSGMQIPSMIDVSSTLDGEPSKLRAFFSGCRMAK
ncbi:hypothetical protein [Caulobacter sp. 17J80-11]|uniref:hypothetical protein n=1 Tax=Caulobacter sp. 17J80-11 TaxID=2763502 RepID=UPI00165397D2|nr:hypothetical protein [Caulobacter sp. 17J80-11]MBC6982169.1 hypothetical protein [Caulobacter sp. 17J80-11]